MRWGYTDGSRNGNRTAGDAVKDYETLQLRGAASAADASVNRDLAAERGNYTEYYKYDKEYDGAIKRLDQYENHKKTVSGIGYKIGFALGRTVRDCKSQINKGKKFLSKSLNKVLGAYEKNVTNKGRKLLSKFFDWQYIESKGNGVLSRWKNAL